MTTDRPLVFDLDDTLYLERDFVISGFAAVGRMVARLTGERDVAATCMALFEAGERRRIFDRLLAERPAIAAKGVGVPELVAHYREHFPDIGLAPDVVDYFARHPDASCGLITDGFVRTQWRKILALGLPPAIMHVRVTAELGEIYHKPHPRAFSEMETALRNGGPPPVYIADNPAKDFLAPNSLGWITVEVARAHRIHTAPAPSPQHAAMRVIGSFAELDDALASLL